MFGLYINDLPLHITNDTVTCDLFADDGSLNCSDKDIGNVQANLQDSLVEVYDWCVTNRMVLNAQKTKSMLITTRQKKQIHSHHLELSVNGIAVEQVTEHQILGVTIDDSFKWQSHINNVNKKLSRNLYLLKQFRYYVDVDALIMYFNAHCLSHINYASTIWCSASDNHIKKLHSLHRRGLKLIVSGSMSGTDNIYVATKMLSLRDQFFFNTATLMFKVTTGNSPSYLQDLLNYAPNRYNSTKLSLPLPRIDLFKSSFAFRGPSVWNSLSVDVKQKTTIVSFKKHLRHSILSGYEINHA